MTVSWMVMFAGSSGQTQSTIPGRAEPTPQGSEESRLMGAGVQRDSAAPVDPAGKGGGGVSPAL